jgi:hypothetical protein
MATRKRASPAPAPAVREGYGYEQVRPLVLAALEAGLSVLVRGHPGIGKSALAQDLAATMGLPLVDIRLAQRDPAEVAGVYFPDRDRHTLELMAPDWVRQACEAPTFIMLDEINAAVTKLHQAAAYQIVLEHRVGPFQFHPGTVVMAAGNLEEDRAIVTPLSSALCNRFVHFIMRPDVESWLAWAARNGIRDEIMAFIGSRGEEVLYQASEDYAFPTPRSWSMASRMMERVDPSDLRRVVAACVGASMADELVRYQKLYQRVDAAAIVRKGLPMDFTHGKDAEPSFVHAAVFCVAEYLVSKGLEQSHRENVVRFLRSPGLDPEYQFLFLRHLRARGRDTLDSFKALPSFRALAGELVGLRTLATRTGGAR